MSSQACAAGLVPSTRQRSDWTDVTSRSPYGGLPDESPETEVGRRSKSCTATARPRGSRKPLTARRHMSIADAVANASGPTDGEQMVGRLSQLPRRAPEPRLEEAPSRTERATSAPPTFHVPEAPSAAMIPVSR